MRDELQPRRFLRRFWLLGIAVASLLPMGCASLMHQLGLADDVAIYRRAETERASRLEAEVGRLLADLRQAEEALILVESGLRGSHTRANAVSSLAEARIQVERAAALAPWRGDRIAEARRKLGEADSQIHEGHFGAALFFVYRSNRIGELLAREARMVRDWPETQYVRQRRVNLRAAPSTSAPVLGILTEGTPVLPERQLEAWTLVRVTSGSVGWVHHSMLSAE